MNIKTLTATMVTIGALTLGSSAGTYGATAHADSLPRVKPTAPPCSRERVCEPYGHANAQGNVQA